MFSWRKKPPPLTDSQWVVLQGEHQGKPMFVRRNVSAVVLVGSSKFQYRVGVAIPCNEQNEQGLPVASELSALDAIEDQLISLLCRNERSVQVLVVTTNGMREFIFYTGDPQACPGVFDAVQASFPTHTIQAYVAKDPDWSVFREFGGAV